MTEAPPHGERGGTSAALGDVLTLNHLHVAGRDCVTGPEVAHAVAALAAPRDVLRLHAVLRVDVRRGALSHFFGWPAPYAYSSLPVLLGTAGGIGLVVGPGGLLAAARARATRRSPMPRRQASIDRSSCCCC